MEEPDQRPSGSRIHRKILIVEDHEGTRTLLANHFEKAGYEVETAAEGNAAVAGALRMRADAIVLDLGRPALDSTDVIAILRSYPTTMETPIVVCSGNVEMLKRRNRIYNALVEKPCTPQDVERAVNEALGDVPASDAG